MTSQSNWEMLPIDANTDERLFFDEHQWLTIEAATARIIPTDHDPGAREANVVRYIDRYISGTDYIYANADGSGFLQLAGKDFEAWITRMQAMQDKYTEGVRELDEVSREKFGAAFIALTEEQQDEVLLTLSGEPPVQPFLINAEAGDEDSTVGGAPPSNQPVSDEGLDFFSHAGLSYETRLLFRSGLRRQQRSYRVESNRLRGAQVAGRDSRWQSHHEGIPEHEWMALFPRPTKSMRRSGPCCGVPGSSSCGSAWTSKGRSNLTRRGVVILPKFP